MIGFYDYTVILTYMGALAGLPGYEEQKEEGEAPVITDEIMKELKGEKEA